MAGDNVIPETVATNSVMQNGADGELKAIYTIVEALKPLVVQERHRVLEYVIGRFGASSLQTPNRRPIQDVDTVVQVPQQSTSYIQDIRTLKETKSPKSANEMAALVAYYVSELAPAGERNKQINKSDIQRYFKMAGFKLPADATFTLVNAKNAGFLETAGGGQYTLNPVGYNLVVHRMGLEETSKKGMRRATVRRAAKKSTHRKK